LGSTDAELSISLVSDPEIARTASRFGRPFRPTDVLAFALREGRGAAHRGACLGDVLISVETAESQAREARRPLDAELRDLLIHGVLHLLGMDHETGPADARRMRALEEHLRWEIARLA
jgi:probable rRNA maturation factor